MAFRGELVSYFPVVVLHTISIGSFHLQRMLEVVLNLVAEQFFEGQTHFSTSWDAKMMTLTLNKSRWHVLC